MSACQRCGERLDPWRGELPVPFAAARVSLCHACVADPTTDYGRFVALALPHERRTA